MRFSNHILVAVLGLALTRFAIAQEVVDANQPLPGVDAAASATNDMQVRRALDHFEKRIRPVLVEHCYTCHSAEAAKAGKLKANLQLDTREGIRRGGDSGPSVVPDQPTSTDAL